MRKEIEIIRSQRRTVSIEIKSDLRVIVRAPLKMKDKDIERFIDSKSDWLKIHTERMREKVKDMERNTDKTPFTVSELGELKKKALEHIPRRAELFASLLGVTYKRITVKHQATRWGSCSSASNLNFNCLLMLCPEDVIDYVVIHELCHLKEMNHSKKFWSEVEKLCPEYKRLRAWLKSEGQRHIRRLKLGVSEK